MRPRQRPEHRAPDGPPIRLGVSRGPMLSWGFSFSWRSIGRFEVLRLPNALGVGSNLPRAFLLRIRFLRDFGFSRSPRRDGGSPRSSLRFPDHGRPTFPARLRVAGAFWHGSPPRLDPQGVG